NGLGRPVQTRREPARHLFGADRLPARHPSARAPAHRGVSRLALPGHENATSTFLSGWPPCGRVPGTDFQSTCSCVTPSPGEGFAEGSTAPLAGDRPPPGCRTTVAGSGLARPVGHPATSPRAFSPILLSTCSSHVESRSEPKVVVSSLIVVLL